MKQTSREDLAEHLRALGLGRGDNVWVQSRLLAFGLIEGGVETVYAAIRDVIGDEGTIVVPTYRLQAPPDEPYDPATSPSLNVGPFSEYLRQRPGAVRSLCPMHSHAAEGPLAAMLREPSGHVSLGPGSDFEQLHRHDFINVYLGIARQFHDAATYPVHVQAMLGNIPYRQWLELKRFIVRDGSVQPFTVRYYGRKKGSRRENLALAHELLQRAGRLRSAPCPYGESCAMSLHDYHEVLRQALEGNPTLFLGQPVEK